MGSYLNWQSSISAEQVFLNDQQYRYPDIKEQQLYYVGTSQDERGRNVLMKRCLNANDQAAICITPKALNLRTRISEYGGKPYWLGEHGIYFVNDSDQRLYRQGYQDDSCQPISPKSFDGKQIFLADIVELSETSLLAVAELARSGSENQHCLVLLDQKVADKFTILHQGADFYSNLVANHSRNKVAWVQWQHPSMPWDDCQLMIADLIAPTDLQTDWTIKQYQNVVFEHSVDESPIVSICQCLFVDDDRLLCVADYEKPDQDWQGYWNIYQVDTNVKTDVNTYKEEQLSAQAVTKIQQEFGYPHWQYGDARLVLLNSEMVIAFTTDKDRDRLYTLELSTQKLKEVPHDYLHFQSIASDADGTAVMLGLHSARQATIVQYRINEGLSNCMPTLASQIAEQDISVAKHLVYPTRDGHQAYAYYYQPQNSEYAEAEGLPALLVMVHGGPTSRAYGHFDLLKQFWTNRGFALLDINHRGSVGYGRAYRDALYEEWGALDCTDIIDAIDYLAAQKLIDPSRVCIRGKSAGGYAVLRALTEYPEYFAAGASYYGIGNLVTLAQLTHKFEQHYTDRLIGEVFDKTTAEGLDSLFSTRSPINKLHDLQSAMIVFQGKQDKVVPPDLAHELVNVLKEQGVIHQYHEYPNEAHGFKQLTNNVDALSKELAFYREVFSK